MNPASFYSYIINVNLYKFLQIYLLLIIVTIVENIFNIHQTLILYNTVTRRINVAYYYFYFFNWKILIFIQIVSI